MLEFLLSFDTQKKYMFDKEQYIDFMRTYDSYSGLDKAEEFWINDCDNKEVQIINEKKAIIMIGESFFTIVPMWCKESQSIRLLNDL